MRPGGKELAAASGSNRKKSQTSLFRLIFSEAVSRDGFRTCPFLSEKPGSGGTSHPTRFKPDKNGVSKETRHMQRWHPKLLESIFAASAIGSAEAVTSPPLHVLAF